MIEEHEQEQEFKSIYNQLSTLQAENKDLTNINTMLNAKFNTLRNQKYGVTFHFFNSGSVFEPIFSKVTNLTSNGERPHSFDTNFDDITIMNWLQECKQTLERKK